MPGNASCAASHGSVAGDKIPGMPRWLQDHPPILWTLIALFVGFNIWYDLSHPFWLVVDTLVVAIVAFLVASRFSR